MIVAGPGIFMKVVMAFLVATPFAKHHHHHDHDTEPVEPPSEPVSVPYSPPSGPLYLSSEQVASYARGAGFPESAISQMVGYASRESHFCPTAVYPGHCADGPAYLAQNPDNACGLWQLSPCTGGQAWLNPAANAAAAYQKYLASGFSPWGG
jgi:hypothetical protein